MRSPMLAIGNRKVTLIFLFGLGIFMLLGSMPAQSQVSRALFNLKAEGEDGNTVNVANKKVTIDTTAAPDPPTNNGPTMATILPTIAERLRPSRKAMFGMAAVLILSGIAYTIYTKRKREAEAIAAQNQIILTLPDATMEQREAATRKAQSIRGRVYNVSLSRECLQRLQALPPQVDGYDGASFALNSVYLLCRDTEKQEPVLSRLLTDGWRLLTSYYQRIPEEQWRKADSDQFRDLLRMLTLETEALIQKSTALTAKSAATRSR